MPSISTLRIKRVNAVEFTRKLALRQVSIKSHTPALFSDDPFTLILSMG